MFHADCVMRFRTESFILGENEKKIEEKADTRTPSTSIFEINKEDHTIGNLLRGRLLQNRHVTFAAYKVCLKTEFLYHLILWPEDIDQGKLNASLLT